jgi:hypothetical protein
MRPTLPLNSREVRWFVEGSVNEHEIVKKWFETTAPVSKVGDVGPPVWKGRLDGKPDVYLLVPETDDIGIKWREGELQIKGRVSSAGPAAFSGGHQGTVEHWTKWSYAELPTAYGELFSNRQQAAGPVVVNVQKTRALRKLRLDTMTGKAEEVSPETIVDRGLGFEFTDLVVLRKKYCSIAFEAFPNDSGMDAAFFAAVSTFLSDLTTIRLSANSYSYPAFLNSLVTASTD